jgi:hypothetical protein
LNSVLWDLLWKLFYAVWSSWVSSDPTWPGHGQALEEGDLSAACGPLILELPGGTPVRRLGSVVVRGLYLASKDQSILFVPLPSIGVNGPMHLQMYKLTKCSLLIKSVEFIKVYVYLQAFHTLA